MLSTSTTSATSERVESTCWFSLVGGTSYRSRQTAIADDDDGYDDGDKDRCRNIWVTGCHDIQFAIVHTNKISHIDYNLQLWSVDSQENH